MHNHNNHNLITGRRKGICIIFFCLFVSGLCFPDSLYYDAIKLSGFVEPDENGQLKFDISKSAEISKILDKYCETDKTIEESYRDNRFISNEQEDFTPLIIIPDIHCTKRIS